MHSFLFQGKIMVQKNKKHTVLLNRFSIFKKNNSVID